MQVFHLKWQVNSLLVTFFPRGQLTRELWWSSTCRVAVGSNNIRFFSRLTIVCKVCNWAKFEFSGVIMYSSWLVTSNPTCWNVRGSVHMALSENKYWGKSCGQKCAQLMNLSKVKFPVVVVTAGWAGHRLFTSHGAKGWKLCFCLFQFSWRLAG